MKNRLGCYFFAIILVVANVLWYGRILSLQEAHERHVDYLKKDRNRMQNEIFAKGDEIKALKKENKELTQDLHRAEK